ncbi:MAG: hypothetical protein P4M00_02255 [Azospirillaceae bacterium]|nr:hypothetical protein [Azospirillaceae bacterium]
MPMPEPGGQGMAKSKESMRMIEDIEIYFQYFCGFAEAFGSPVTRIVAGSFPKCRDRRVAPHPIKVQRGSREQEWKKG